MGHLSTFVLFNFFILLTGATKSSALSILHPLPMHYYHLSTSLVHLAGSRKGDDTPGIRVVKNYLNRFGYLNDLTSGANQVAVDLFDDSLEHALLTYQEFFKLNKTGVLDHDTISMMSKPRCGCRDIFNKFTKNDAFSDHFKKHYKFFPNKPHRKGKFLFYEFRADISVTLKNGIIKAFADWEPYLPLKFVNSDDPHSSDVIVEFFRGEHGDGHPFDGSGPILAHAGQGEGSLFHFDADENWQVGAVPGGIDITTVATHEIGHLLGLAHSDVESAIMYPVTDVGKVKKIGTDDIMGIKALYYGYL